MRNIARLSLALAIAASSSLASAATVDVLVVAENLAPMNSISFAPLRVGFNSGVFDAFNMGSPAMAGIISIAEGGSGSDWFPAFGAADPGANLGTVVPNPPGPLTPGASGSAVFTIDTDVNPYFTFAAMAVPSNDYFIGNDSPTEHQLFDGAGNLIINNITLKASDIWDAGSEVDGIFGAAFLTGSNNSDRIADTENVHHDFADLSIFNGQQTAAGYTFDSQLGAATDVYRISFQIVPEPASAAMLLLTGGGLLLRRRRMSAV
ncbi:MAG: spondin domain-containing protein [Phycisphaerales bacterium]|nr:spondin domain-containing protein [Phycisphaerales bacterium]MCB9862324.1 spondin domain-containing protein [Phycisphaerales bacterium]